MIATQKLKVTIELSVYSVLLSVSFIPLRIHFLGLRRPGCRIDKTADAHTHPCIKILLAVGIANLALPTVVKGMIQCCELRLSFTIPTRPVWSSTERERPINQLTVAEPTSAHCAAPGGCLWSIDLIICTNAQCGVFCEISFNCAENNALFLFISVNE